METREVEGAPLSSVSDWGRMEQGLLGSGLLGRLSIFSINHTGWDCVCVLCVCVVCACVV